MKAILRRMKVEKSELKNTWLRKFDFQVSTLRIRFSELFAVMEILCDDGAQNPRTSRRRAGKKPIDLSDVSKFDYLFNVIIFCVICIFALSIKWIEIK